MRRIISVLAISSLVLVGLFATSTMVSADPLIIEDGFVCPVLGGQAGVNGNYNGITNTPNFPTVLGPEVSVPRQATNGNNGINNPGGPYASPGETDYTAIWP